MFDSNPTESEEPDRPQDDPQGVGKEGSQGEAEEGYEIEPEPEVPESSVAPDTSAAQEHPEAGDRRCERCGAPLPEDQARTPCPSCGFDAATGGVVDPDSSNEASTTESTENENEEEPATQLFFAEGLPMPWLVAAGVIALVVVFAMLAGWSSFYPRADGRFLNSSGEAVLDAPAVMMRFVAVGKYLVGSLVLVGTAAIAARITCWFEEIRPGDLQTGVAKLGLLVIVASLVRLIGFDSSFLQTMIQYVLGAAIVFGGTVFILGRRDRTAIMFLLAWVLVVLLVIPVTSLVSWSLPLW